MRVKSFQILILLLAASCLIFTSCGAKSDDDTGEFATCDLFESEDLNLSCLNGESIDSEYITSHDLTVINIWATYCEPCIREMPVLESISNEKQDTIGIVGLISDIYKMDGSVDEQQLEKANYILTQLNVSYPNIMADESILNDIFSKISAVPTTLFIDSSGKIVGSHIGSMDETAWENIINSFLQSSRADFLRPLTPPYVPFGIRRFNSNNNPSN